MGRPGRAERRPRDTGQVGVCQAPTLRLDGYPPRVDVEPGAVRLRTCDVRVSGGFQCLRVQRVHFDRILLDLVDEHLDLVDLPPAVAPRAGWGGGDGRVARPAASARSIATCGVACEGLMRHACVKNCFIAGLPSRTKPASSTSFSSGGAARPCERRPRRPVRPTRPVWSASAPGADGEGRERDGPAGRPCFSARRGDRGP